MAGTVEAIIGAVYLDGGMHAVPPVMQTLGLMPKLIRRTVPKDIVAEEAAEMAPEESTNGADKDTDAIKSNQGVVGTIV